MTVSISRAATGGTNIILSYKGKGFRRLYEKRERLVHIFSNEAIKRNTGDVVF